MRFVQLVLAILYVFALLSGTTKSVSEDWVDTAEAKFYSEQLLSSSTTVSLSETLLDDKKKDSPPILASHTWQWPQQVLRNFCELSIDNPVLEQPVAQAMPRAPPVLLV